MLHMPDVINAPLHLEFGLSLLQRLAGESAIKTAAQTNLLNGISDPSSSLKVCVYLEEKHRCGLSAQFLIQQ